MRDEDADTNTESIKLEEDRMTFGTVTKLYTASSDPSGGEAGDLYFNNSANPGTVKVYNGTAWEDLH